jgi:beta-alanine degradation protein BauB
MSDPAMGEAAPVLGPMGDRIVFENDRVRIWEIEIPPGGDSNVHEHELDYVLVILGGDRVAAVQEPGSGSALPEYFEADVTPGQAVFVNRGGVETARNVGDVPYSEIIIELKD